MESDVCAVGQSIPEVGTLDWDQEGSQHSTVSTEESSRKPMPLDLLLSSSLVLEETQTCQSTEEQTVSRQQLMESLSISEKQCKHLAALLAESEASEARLSQLTQALKEEIRRNERSEERQKHIENLEYLKNVVLKVSDSAISCCYFCKCDSLSFEFFQVSSFNLELKIDVMILTYL